jgi:hypothetical protein
MAEKDRASSQGVRRSPASIPGPGEIPEQENLIWMLSQSAPLSKRPLKAFSHLMSLQRTSLPHGLGRPLGVGIGAE